MDTYFVKNTDVGQLQSALGRLIEYAKFLEKDTGRDQSPYAFVDTILKECDIECDIVDSSIE